MDNLPPPIERPPLSAQTIRAVRAMALLGLALLISYGAWMFWRLQHDPALIYLSADEGAEWIVADEPVSLDTRPTGNSPRAFRIRFALPAAPHEATLDVRALRVLNVLINGKVVLDTTASPERWKEVARVQLAPALTAGSHELLVLVRNEVGPAAL